MASLAKFSYNQYKLQNATSSSTKASDFTQYMNYVALDTSGSTDGTPVFSTPNPCSGVTNGCLKLHNGGTLVYRKAESFGGTTVYRGLWFQFDPDGIVSNNKSIQFFQLYSGQMVDDESLVPSNTTIQTSVYDYDTPDVNPTWFGKW